jgi:hypothetical protein
LFLTIFELLLAGMAAIYAGAVLITFWSEGKGYQAKFDLRKPAESAERLLIWVGILVVSFLVRVMRAALDTLEDASADVGEWFVHHHGAGH